jgi:hypothetical protein
VKEVKEFVYFVGALISEIANDTLKKDDGTGFKRWSRTSLTMFSAWLITCYIAISDFHKHGYNSEVFYCMCAISLGIKITDAISKKIK